MPGSVASSERVAWVDLAKGMCIIMVVMVHATLGVELAVGAEGWMHHLVAFARPFRMPDFFLISGLFLGLVIDRPWRRYVDRKVVHFAYFYVLWLTIQFAFKAPGMAMENGAAATLEAYLTAYLQPFGTLWFIYLLPVFFIVTRLLKGLPAWLVLIWAAALEILPVATGIVVFDEFCSRFVYFFAGYALATHIFAYAGWVRENVGKFLAFCAVWAPLNALLVFTPAPAMLAPLLQADLGFTGATGGWSELAVMSLLLGLAGCLFVVGVAAALTRVPWMGWLRWLGAHSIVIYLAFFLPMAVTRIVLVKTGLIADVGTMAALTTAAAVVGPVILYWMVGLTGYGRFLFERPAWASIDRPKPAGQKAAIPAE